MDRTTWFARNNPGFDDLSDRADPAPVGIGSSKTASACPLRWGRFFWRTLKQTRCWQRRLAKPGIAERHHLGRSISQGAFAGAGRSTAGLAVWAIGAAGRERRCGHASSLAAARKRRRRSKDNPSSRPMKSQSVVSPGISLARTIAGSRGSGWPFS